MSVATVQLSAAARAGTSGLSVTVEVISAIMARQPESWSAARKRGSLSSCMSRL